MKWQAAMPEPASLKVLLAVDGSTHSEAAVALVAGLGWPAGTSVSVLAVAPERWSLLGLSAEARQVVDEISADSLRAQRAGAERIAAQATKRLQMHGLTAEAETGHGRPSEVILQRAGELPADLVVIGARGLSAPGEFYLGSTAHELTHYAECPVLVVRPPEREQPVNVILAADGSHEALLAAEFLCALPLPQWAEVAVVSVAEVAVGLPTGERDPVADVPDVVRRLLLDSAEVRAAAVVEQSRRCGARVRAAIRLGHPTRELLAAADEEEADLIIVGARGQTQAEPFRLGGVAQKIVKYAPCSVLVVR